jgi:antitoxin component YwqK of YwqJK toxin-antitoxin module
MISLFFTGCKPRTRRTETNEEIRRAMMIKAMDDSLKEENLNRLPDYTRQNVITLLKKYEQLTGVVEFEDYLLSVKITMKVSLENGTVRSGRGEYGNGVLALVFYPVKNREMIDSAYRYYPSGHLYSRRITPVDTLKRIYEEFYESGTIRSRNSATMLFNWHPNGNISAKFIFDNGQVIQRTLWHENGTVKEMSGWQNDSLNGLYQVWDSLGHQTRKEQYAAGVLLQKMVN